MDMYNKIANKIIKQSIKSAVFIDEKALSFGEKNDSQIYENQLSLELYSNFKTTGISLAVHKYQVGDEENENTLNYLFNDRDLVLLDWKLEGKDGEERSLRLLADIVTKPHIHFCVVYTSENNKGIDNVFANILSYFTSEDENYFKKLKEELEDEEDIIRLKDKIDNINIHRHSVNIGRKIGELIKEGHKGTIDEIIRLTEESDKVCALSKASIALNDFFKSSEPLPCPSTSSFENKSLTINNTIILILNKSENTPEDLINNISGDIIKSKNSFTQLLGLEMQSVFAKSSSFIDDSIIQFSKDAVLYHREHYKKEGTEHLFPEFIKDILLEKAKLNLRSERLSLLEDEVLDSQETPTSVDDKELISMNVFYNSSKHTGEDKKLNFGDVFKREAEGKIEYYICITALCDCLRPDKNKFFFAKGESIKQEKALKLGDTAFISFLSKDDIVKWTTVNTKITDELHKYSPVYIKPIQFTVVEPKFNNDTELAFKTLNEGGNINEIKVKYLSTVKSNYAQRIANHAFSHPIRVGVDFVKK